LHCCVAPVRDYLVVRAFDTACDTHINGKRITEGKLKSGDELMVGRFKYRFVLGMASRVSDAPAGKKNSQSGINKPAARSSEVIKSTANLNPESAMGVRICPRCGHENEAKEKYCEKCRSDLSVPVTRSIASLQIDKPDSDKFFIPSDAEVPSLVLP